MRGPRWLLWFFLITSALAGFVFWRETDWWAYYSPGWPPHRERKFELPPAVQFLVSAVVGVLAGGLLTFLAFAVRQVWAVRKRA